MEAWFASLEKAHSDGLDLAAIHSVASLFVSRTDVKIHLDDVFEMLGREDVTKFFEPWEELMTTLQEQLDKL